MQKETLDGLKELANFLKKNLHENEFKTLKNYAKNPAIIDWEELHMLITSDIAIAEDNKQSNCPFKEEFSHLHSRLKNNDHDYLMFILFELQGK